MKFKFLILIFFVIISNKFILGEEKEAQVKNNQSNIKYSSEGETSNRLRIHIVKKGDTLSKIAKLYSIEKKRIIEINKLENENYIYIGQNLKIIANNIDSFKLENERKQNYHKVVEGDNLTDIAINYDIDLNTLVSINKIDNNNSIKVGSNLLINKNLIDGKQQNRNKKLTQKKVTDIPKSKRYGPLIIESEKLIKKGRRNILNAINRKKESLILALDCKEKEIDIRAKGKKWKGWMPAKRKFELELIKDFCQIF